MSRGSTVQANSLRKVVDAARAAGLDATALLAEVGLGAEALDVPDARVSFAALVELYERVARRTGDDAFGLRVGMQTTPGMFDVLGQAVMCAETLEGAFATIARYLRVLQDGATVVLERDGDLAGATYAILDTTVGPARHEVEATLAIIFRFLEGTLGGAFAPREVRFAHAAPGDPRLHAELFRAPVAFGRSSNTLVFDAALLARPMPRADRSLSSILERHIVDLLARLPEATGIAGDVRAAIARALPGGEPAIAAIAKALGTSARTLQRRLAEERVTFNELLDDTRRQLALRYLEDPARGISQTAFELGYAELSAFHRAFRRWTGEGPGDWRRARRGQRSNSA